MAKSKKRPLPPAVVERRRWWSAQKRVRKVRLEMLGMTYSEYLSSPLWHVFRNRVMARACFGCGTPFELCLHHVTYARLGCERESDVVTLCNDCHKTVHRVVRQLGLDLDPRLWAMTIRQASSAAHHELARRRAEAQEQAEHTKSRRAAQRARKLADEEHQMALFARMRAR